MTERNARHWIGGEWANTGAEKHSINPATGARLARFATAKLKLPRQP